MTSFSYEFGYIRACESSLKNYLFSSDLYWPIGVKASPGETPYPMFTLGNMLLSQKKAQVLTQSTKEHLELDRTAVKIEAIHSRWRSAWENKASVEFHSRLNLWSNFLVDYREHPASNYDRYAYEVNRRALLELLAPEASEAADAEFETLSSLDRYLEAVYISGDFIWDQELMAGFPEDVYWYLYGNLQE